MSWVTVVWSMAAAVCLTLAGINLLVWWRLRTAWGNVFFALTALAAVGMAGSELWMMHAATAGEFALAVRWMHVPAWVGILALVGFVRVYLRAGRPWLAWAVCAMRTVSLALDFLTGVNLNYWEITAVRPIGFLGEPVFVAVGVPNPWMLVGQASLLLLVVFVADATVAVWRRGERRQALLVGVSMIFFVVLSTVQAVLAFWSIVPMPISTSLFFLGIVMGMAYELSRDVLRAAQLAHELSESENKTNELRQELAHASRVTMLGQLASTLAHELNQPLGAILRNAEAAELFLKMDVPDIDEALVILADIRKDDQRASGVIKRMRDLLQRRELEMELLDVAELIREVAVFIRRDAEARQVAIETRLPDGLPLVRGDWVQLQQVLLNLILNGMDALDSQTVPERRVILEALERDAGLVEIAVSDNGHGIPADRLGKLFQPFFTTKAEGMGIGLAISRTIIEAHGGSIGAANNAQRGAIFRVTLPCADAQVHA
jgi:signal transduction histidine kinase